MINGSVIVFVATRVKMTYITNYKFTRLTNQLFEQDMAKIPCLETKGKNKQYFIWIYNKQANIRMEGHNDHTECAQASRQQLWTPRRVHSAALKNKDAPDLLYPSQNVSTFKSRITSTSNSVNSTNNQITENQTLNFTQSKQ